MIAKLEELALTNPYAADLQQSIAWICAGLGEKENDRSFAALERAKASRDPSMAWLLSSRYLLPLQSDPRWEKLKRSMGLAEETSDRRKRLERILLRCSTAAGPVSLRSR